MEFVLLEICSLWGVREPWSTLSHLLGVLTGLVALPALVQEARRLGLPPRAVGSLVVYGVSMILVFTASTLFHLFDWPAERLVLLRKLDHAAIFLIIAGTSTAVYGTLQARWALRLVAVTWMTALCALLAKMLVWPMTSLDSALVYLSVACIPASGSIEMARRAGWKRLKLLTGGLVVFLVGAVVFVTGWPVVWPGYVEGHEVFHGLVLLGIGMHYWFIYRYCTRCGAVEAAWRPVETATPAHPHTRRDRSPKRAVTRELQLRPLESIER